MTTPIFNRLENKGSDMAQYNEGAVTGVKANSNLDGLKNVLAAKIEELSHCVQKLESTLTFVLCESEVSDRSEDATPKQITSPVESYIDGLTEDIARITRRVSDINNRVTL